MKRSEINHKIREAIQFFESMNFKLPPWGYWTLQDWKRCRESCTEIYQNGLGWDLTDFGSGDFERTGLLLFTIRNGNLEHDSKSYAEKIMIVGESQVTPLHFHWSKMEDIINRGGGNLIIELYPSSETEKLADHEIDVSMDGIRKKVDSGALMKLTPGESITLYQGLYHRFYGEEGHGNVLVGEVSAVNDDNSDNRFLEETGRFPRIEEDEDPVYLLVGDYTRYI